MSENESPNKVDEAAEEAGSSGGSEAAESDEQAHAVDSIEKPVKPFWNPYVAGIALGLVLLASFVVTGKGLGASGAVNRMVAAGLHWASPTWAEENKLIGSFFTPGSTGLNAWIVFVFIGALLGALTAVLTAGRFRVETIHGPRIHKEGRWALAFAGGMLSGIAAQIARGCTSGQALTGGAQLALGSWVFMFSVFGGAYCLAWFVRKQWI